MKNITSWRGKCVHSTHLIFWSCVVIAVVALSPCVWAGNVALNKPATASATYSTYVPSLAVDGDVGTYWNGGGSLPAWLKVDLQQEYSLQRAMLISPGGSHVYDLLGSDDDIHWKNIATGLVVTSTTPVPIPIAGQSFRYLRCDVTGGGDWAALAELEAYPVVEISGIIVTSGVVRLTLTNCLSDVTNTVESASDLTNPASWESVTNLTGIADSTIWREDISNAWERVFYRINSSL